MLLPRAGRENVDLSVILTEKKTCFEVYLEEVAASCSDDDRVSEAAFYSLRAGGKRLRPALTMLACETVGGEAEAALPVALAIEMIHTFSLIHDDLPAIDNDDLRRGRPTCHRRYDEATAILAGDALIFRAFELVSRASYAPEVRVDLCRAVADAGYGLIRGELADIRAEGRDVSDADVVAIHADKTARLFELSLYAGARVGGADDQTAERLRRYGYHIGLAFQAVDDVLDVTATAEDLGKTAGKDLLQDKATLIKTRGVEGVRAWAAEATTEAVSCVRGLDRTGALVGLADFMLQRAN